MNAPVELLCGDWIDVLRTLPDSCVQCCVTSPPYFGLRNYGVEGQVGLEKSPGEYIAKLVEGFREVRRVLKPDGVLFLNLGDSYAGSWGNYGGHNRSAGKQRAISAGSRVPNHAWDERTDFLPPAAKGFPGIKPKDLIGIPWMAAFALRDDGWWLRSEITWCKKAPMPESVTDRPTSATEQIFLLTKSERYFYDAGAVRNPPSKSWANDGRWKTGSTDKNEKNGYHEAGAQNPKKLHRMFDKQRGHSRRHAGFNDRWDAMSKEQQMANGSNMRNFWVLGPEPCREAHFATFPSEVPRRCILAGSRPGDIILDPFGGSGTTAFVAVELGRRAINIELNPKYLEIAQRRCDRAQPPLPLK